MSASEPPNVPAPSSGLFGNFVIVLFLIAQVLDGAFTYLGISSFGLSEGNPLIAHYIREHGLGVSLTAAKVLAVICAMALHLLGLHRTLGLLTLLYLSCAVLPWSYLIFIVHW
ncbi:MAG TPA: DUF5658 family protein [Vicinamibacterales bacterium]